MTNKAEQPTITQAQYESAVKGRQDFRNAYRNLLPVLRAAEGIVAIWRAKGRKVDVTEYWDAINAIDVAVTGGGAKPDPEHLTRTTSLAAQDVEREPMREYCNEAIYEPKVADSYPRPSLAAQDGLDDELRNALAAAYVAGATDVHNHWAEGDAANNMDPDFGEAGWDYAHSIDVSAIKGDKS